MERGWDGDLGCHEAFMLLDQVRPGTISGLYKMKVHFRSQKPIGGLQSYTFDTGPFEVRERPPVETTP